MSIDLIALVDAIPIEHLYDTLAAVEIVATDAEADGRVPFAKQYALALEIGLIRARIRTLPLTPPACAL